jgi:hypothetical protein
MEFLKRLIIFRKIVKSDFKIIVAMEGKLKKVSQGCNKMQAFQFRAMAGDRQKGVMTEVAKEGNGRRSPKRGNELQTGVMAGDRNKAWMETGVGTGSEFEDHQ